MSLDHTKIYVEKKPSEELTIRSKKLKVDKMKIVALLGRVPFKVLKEFVDTNRKYL